MCPGRQGPGRHVGGRGCAGGAGRGGRRAVGVAGWPRLCCPQKAQRTDQCCPRTGPDPALPALHPLLQPRIPQASARGTARGGACSAPASGRAGLRRAGDLSKRQFRESRGLEDHSLPEKKMAKHVPCHSLLKQALGMCAATCGAALSRASPLCPAGKFSSINASQTKRGRGTPVAPMSCSS